MSGSLDFSKAMVCGIENTNEITKEIIKSKVTEQ